MDKVEVLDKGYVRLVRVGGNELDIVNAARVSYAKESTKFGNRDARLLKFLIEHGHTSPLRHVNATFEIKAPLIVARQWFKYRVGSAHSGDTLGYVGPGEEDQFDMMSARNEGSGRYITMDEEFYIPTEWRKAPANSKQGSGGIFGDRMNRQLNDEMERVVYQCMDAYQTALDAGVAREQARLFLPYAAAYTMWRWTGSLDGVLWFLKQRLAHDAQYEITEYAKAVKNLIGPHFPNVFEAMEL